MVTAGSRWPDCAAPATERGPVPGAAVTCWLLPTGTSEKKQEGGRRDGTGNSWVHWSPVHYDPTRPWLWKTPGFRASHGGDCFANLALDFMCCRLRNGAVFQCGGKGTTLAVFPLAGPPQTRLILLGPGCPEQPGSARCLLQPDRVAFLRLVDGCVQTRPSPYAEAQRMLLRARPQQCVPLPPWEAGLGLREAAGVQGEIRTQDWLSSIPDAWGIVPGTFLPFRA